jgi:hypothetical protein
MLNCWGAIFSGALNGLGLQRKVARTAILCDVIQLTLTILTVPRFGLSGFVVGFVLSSAVSVGLDLRELCRSAGMKPKWKEWLFAPVTAAVLSGMWGNLLFRYLTDNGIGHDHACVGEDMAKRILRRLKFDNDTIYKVSKIVRYHDYGNGMEPTHRIVRRAIHTMGEDIYPYMFAVRQADIFAQSLHEREEKLSRLEKGQSIYEEILGAGDCLSLKDLAVTGKDLIDAGVKPGPELGEILSGMLEQVLEDPSKNTKEYLLTLI